MPGPGGLPGCVLWLRSDDLDATLNDNDPVSLWADRSGNGKDVSESGTARPLFKANRVNGWPGVLFDGTDDKLTRAHGLGFSANPAIEIYVVCRRIGGSAGEIFEVGDNAGGTRKVHRVELTATTSGLYHNSGFYAFPADGASWAVRTYSRPKDGTISATKYYEDGVEQTSTSSSNPGQTVTLDNERIVLGAGGSGAGFTYGNVEIAELVVFDRQLSTTERTALWAYLDARYIAAGYPVTVPSSPSAVALAINGTAREVKEGTISIRHQAHSPSTASFEVLDPGGTITIPERAEVVIYRGSGGLFGGHVMSVVTRVVKGSSRRHTVYARGYEYLAEKRLVRGVYENTQAETIVRDLLEFYLGPEYVVEGTISSAGPSISRIEFGQGTTVAKALDQLAELAGNFYWAIQLEIPSGTQPLRTFEFFAEGERGSGQTLNSGNVMLDTLEVERSSPDYRNRQHLTGGGATSSRVEVFKGDGDRRSFGVGYPILRTPAVRTDIGAGYVTRTVGIKGKDTGKDWYWNEGSEFVTQDEAGTVLATTHKIEITYVGRTELAIVASDSAEIAANAAIEGSSGIVEREDEEDWVGSATEGGELASARLDHYKRPTTRLKVRQRQTSFVAVYTVGYSYTISGILGLPGTMYGEAVEVGILPKAAGLDLRLSLVDGTPLSSWETRLRRDRERRGRTQNLIDVIV